ncbi:chromosome segregation protein SMC [Clostridium sp. SYSU_GA19001]|uniref:chromosome segregation protein SMC n=1 Tax=Clostridium caldaquaticum TaxID=2940653 RepID=UPI0020770A2C|nr:chromosome segregation protein SMC [Clostridium caldaquaticum]MCM8710597.1 chromosome segregation protein SMC [Clostridium caldaquaticum]
MFLKSIEIRGFKSFADKTELNFMKGVTSVVGPNGSGKSNISDAVRWVLGEQSVKSLRGGKMEDVIFAGTQFRKPVGLAQVSLTLDNSDNELPIDYSDVTISRRLYRSGESEYYINNTQCRLKDIQELFMDTGIGKEGYSIIGQGKIDAVLSGKPEERRSLLEEAAGIVKFKSRKEEAEKKLEITEQNLVRIGDIIRTYEERLEPLKIESEKAKLFLNLSTQLKEKEVNLLLHSIQFIEDKIKDIKNNIQSSQKDLSIYVKEKEVNKNRLQKLNDDLEKHELKIQRDQQEYYKNKSDYQSVYSETNLLEERIKNLQAFIEKNLHEINIIDSKLKTLQFSKDEQETNLNKYQREQLDLNNTINLVEKEILDFNKQLNSSELSLNELKNENIKLLNKISEVKNEIFIINSEQIQLGKKIQELVTSCEHYINSLKINSNTKVMLENNVLELSSKIKTLEEEIKKNRLEITKLNGYINKDEKKLKEYNAKSNKLEANYQMLQNLEKQYDGYNRSVKILMQNINSGKIPDAKSNCFVFGDIISVSKELEIAIEIALGGAISDIITKDENTAKLLINYLKINNLGRATFLPLNIIKGKPLNNIEQIKILDGFVGIASELVSYEFRFKNAIEYILGRTIIAKDLDTALKIAKKTNYNYKIVTLSGEIINSGGSLTGGSIFNKSTSIISRKREIEETALDLQQTNILIEELVQKIDVNRQSVKKLDEIYLNLKDEVYYKNIEITKLNGKIAAISSEDDRISQSLTVSKQQIKDLKNKENINLEKLNQKEILLQNMIALEKTNSTTIKESEFKLKDRRDSLINLKEKHTTLKIKKAQIDEMVINKIRELQRLSNELDELNKKSNALSQEIKESQMNIKSSKESVEENKIKLNKIESYLSKLEIVFKDSEIERIKIKENIKIIEDDLERLSLILNKKEEEIHKKDLSLAKLDVEKEALYSKLNEEMSLTYAEALKYKYTIHNMEEYRKDIFKLKNEITALGTVNVGAIEEYKEVKEKYVFMSSQIEDLTKAKSELIEMINDMTAKMKSVFSENLNNLRIIFKETFRELFKGGNADLILTEGDELTANIEINVEPPGKKLQNINLMSGGEKVLSAIALLFAILKMKPTPFCILDEIEAALDDANVARYAEFLRKFSNNIQFIVITHRKGTMEVSDVLYGVTMEEKGISKVVSIDLNKQSILI